MTISMKKIVLFAMLFGFLFSCSNKIKNVEKAFYYWKTNEYSLYGANDSILKKVGATKLYVKFFEVEKNEVMGYIPVVKTQLSTYNQDSLTIIPTVYIRNEVFLKSSKGSLDTLADNVNFLIDKYSKNRLDRENGFAEYQMDCDWTINSKENYFYFLKKLKEISKKEISCTLRLYPYKYPDKMGIPPVDKVTLMCYNLINPIENPKKNSILDVDELASYLNVKTKYPIHLDIALPIYSWMQVYQNDRFVKVIYNNHGYIKKHLKAIKPLWYELTEDVELDDIYLRVGDKIKYEEITAAEIEKAIEIIKKKVVFDDTTTVTLFHLDNEQIKQFSNEEIARFYTDFSK